MKKRLFILLAAALMLGVATPTMAQQKKTTAKRTTTTTKKSPPTTAKPATGSATNNNVARGDLGIFELKGPVKSFVFKNQWGETTRTFDKNGTWLTKDGQSLKQIYQSGIRRDKNGRIVKGIMDSDGNGEEYYYNAKGWITKRTFHYYDTTQEDTYTYDANGNLLKMRVVEGGLDASEPYTEVYETLATDEFCNWTKRYSKIGSEKSIETRTITYYEGPKPKPETKEGVEPSKPRPTNDSIPRHEDKTKVVPPPAPKPHIHSYMTSISFGTPQEMKVKKTVQFAFPKEVKVSCDDNEMIFTRLQSDLGNNVYICNDGLGGFKTIEDAEQYVAELNDSLQKADVGYVLRLATKKEVSRKVPTFKYEGEEDFKYYFDEQSCFTILALEYNKDRNGTIVAPDHVNVVETITRRCSCGDTQCITYQRQFKNMSQCQVYINKRKE